MILLKINALLIIITAHQRYRVPAASSQLVLMVVVVEGHSMTITALEPLAGLWFVLGVSLILLKWRSSSQMANISMVGIMVEEEVDFTPLISMLTRERRSLGFLVEVALSWTNWGLSQIRGEFLDPMGAVMVDHSLSIVVSFEEYLEDPAHDLTALAFSAAMWTKIIHSIKRLELNVCSEGRISYYAN